MCYLNIRKPFTVSPDSLTQGAKVMNKTVTLIQGNFDRVYGMLEKIVEACPDSLWTDKKGGFLFWQQIYHVFAIVDFFILEEGQKPTQELYPSEVARLLRDESNTPTKAQVLDVARVIKAAANAYFEKLTEEDLWKRNENRSQRFGREVPVLDALIMLVGHGFYHVGACDAILRDHGVKGMM